MYLRVIPTPANAVNPATAAIEEVNRIQGLALTLEHCMTHHLDFATLEQSIVADVRERSSEGLCLLRTHRDLSHSVIAKKRSHRSFEHWGFRAWEPTGRVRTG